MIIRTSSIKIEDSENQGHAASGITTLLQWGRRRPTHIRSTLGTRGDWLRIPTLHAALSLVLPPMPITPPRQQTRSAAVLLCSLPQRTRRSISSGTIAEPIDQHTTVLLRRMISLEIPYRRVIAHKPLPTVRVLDVRGVMTFCHCPHVVTTARSSDWACVTHSPT